MKSIKKKNTNINFYFQVIFPLFKIDVRAVLLTDKGICMSLRFFILVFVSFFSHVYSDYHNLSEVPCPSSIMTIEAVDVSDKTTFFLNNGTLWTCNYKDLFEGSYAWRLGDRVNIVYVFFEGYYLQNVSCQGCVPVKLQNANSPDLKVNTIKEIIKNDEKSSNKIILDNGTRWFGWWSSLWMAKWKVGDRIIVTEQEFICGDADHLLLNIDRDGSPNVRAQLLYSPEKIKFIDYNKRKTRDWKIYIACAWLENDSFII